MSGYLPPQVRRVYLLLLSLCFLVQKLMSTGDIHKCVLSHMGLILHVQGWSHEAVGAVFKSMPPFQMKQLLQLNGGPSFLIIASSLLFPFGDHSSLFCQGKAKGHKVNYYARNQLFKRILTVPENKSLYRGFMLAVEYMMKLLSLYLMLL